MIDATKFSVVEFSPENGQMTNSSKLGFGAHLKEPVAHLANRLCFLTNQLNQFTASLGGD
jgi:hypothetical protein